MCALKPKRISQTTWQLAKKEKYVILEHNNQHHAINQSQKYVL